MLRKAILFFPLLFAGLLLLTPRFSNAQDAGVLMDQEQMNKVRHLTGYLLNSAREQVVRGNQAEAAMGLELAAPYMGIESGHDKTQPQQEVRNAAEEVMKVATLMKGGSKTSVKTIDATIFQAHRALARYHLERVRTYLQADLLKNSGIALEAAVVHYQDAALSIARAQDKEVDPELSENAKKAMAVAASLKKDSREYKTRAQQGVRTFSQAIEDLGKMDM